MTDANAGPLPSEWRAFRTRLLHWVRPRVGDPADAEDLVQDILATANDRLPSLRSRQLLVPWLDAIARNALVDYYRRRGRAPETVGVASDLGASAPELHPDAEPDRAALAACLRPMLRALPTPYREAVTRVDLDGERQVDLAAELGLGGSALKSRVQRGRAMLRDAFAACCALERDAGGRVVDFAPRGSDCGAAPDLVQVESGRRRG